MKDMLVLLVLLNSLCLQLCSQPYQVPFGKECRDKAREYLLDDSNLCCEKCPPGRRLNRECSETSESDCQNCGSGLYMDTWNYYKNCFSCTTCKETKGLQYAQTCSPTANAKCVCQPGMFCIMDFDGSSCTECRKYRPCKAGFGVSEPGTAASNLRCESCPSGTFSDTVSTTDPCRPHTQCGEGAVVKRGNATSDTVCKNPTPETPADTRVAHTTTASTIKSTVETKLHSMAPHVLRGSTQPLRPSAAEELFKPTTSSTTPTTESQWALASAGAIGVICLLIIFALLCVYKRVWRKDSARLQPKVDANGNCKGDDKTSLKYLEESQMTSFTVASSEQKCLLEKLETGNDQSQRSNNTDTSARTDGDNSHSSIGPSQSTFPFDSLTSALSEPMSLISNAAEPGSAQSSAPIQSSSQPTSPQIISPVSPSSHVNVNITLNIGNGSGGLQSAGPANSMQGDCDSMQADCDSMQADCDLPFGEKEECFCTPQQEDGKQSIMSVS